MLKFFKYLFFVCSFFFFTNGMALESNWSIGTESKVRLISPISHNNHQSTIFLGLEYELQDGWKTYWQSPGDGGFPQEIKWNKSLNVKSVEIFWPTPNQFEILGMQSIGYTNNVIFPIKINLKDISKLTQVILDINYLVCKDICIPGNGYIELFLPSGLGELTQHSFTLEKTLSELPMTSVDLSFIESVNTYIFADEKTISLQLLAKAKKFFNNPSVFLHTKYGLPVINPKITLSPNSKNLEAVFTFKKSLIEDKKIKTQFIIADQKNSFVTNKIISVQNKSFILNQSYLLILLFAFVGGLILNAMPCVLPVLSIKILSMLQNLEDQKSIRRSFISTSVGIISSFILLAISFMFLRYLGINIGWGMQFQQPIFLMIIGLILLFFSFNLFGFFEIPIPNFINTKRISELQLNNYTRDFFNGFFATVMATPCSAPFVGTALTAAFTQSFVMMFFIFFFMSIGMASPYLFFSIFPKFLYFFPKPGKWTVYLKYFLGLLLLATLVWISNIMLNHFNYYFILTSLILILATLFFNHFYKIKKIILLFCIVIFFTLPNFSIFKSDYKKIDSDWLNFNSINVQELIKGDNIVFIDITADWCATCQYNKINVLNTKKIKEAFSKFQVIKVKGDWTKPDPIIQKFLKENNKFGIPFNVIYNKNNTKGIILSELLSVNEIINVLDKLKLK